MDMISTKELSERWQLSTSRIVRLAKAGRIPGAMLIGKSWVFPPDTKRLSDNRRKEQRNTAVFRFPLYFYINCSDKELERFSPDEHALYEAECLYMKNDLSKCIDALIPLKSNTTDFNVRMGALYFLCLSYFYTKRCAAAYNCFCEMNAILTEDTPHYQELSFLIHDLETYFIGTRYYLNDFQLDIQNDCSPQMKGYFFLQSAFSDLLKSLLTDHVINPLPYEMYCRFEGASLSPLCLTLLHLYVGIIYKSIGSQDKSINNIAASCRIAEENDLEREIAFLYHYVPEYFAMAIRDSNPAQLERLKSLSKQLRDMLSAQHESAGKFNILGVLDSSDLKYIIYAEKGLTNKEIAALLKLSPNTISKKYAVIFEKTGVHSKHELADIYARALLEF